MAALALATIAGLVTPLLPTRPVSRPDGWAYLVLEGDAELTGVAEAVDDAVVDELVELYRSLQGEHPDWDEYRRAMVADCRLIVRLGPKHAFGMWPEG